MTDKEICKKIGVGFEWLDENYDSLDEAAKHAMDGLAQAIPVLATKYGMAKGFIIGGVVATSAMTAVVSGAASVAGCAIYDKWKKRLENRLNETEPTDSE